MTTSTMRVRRPAVAGLFYPEDPAALRTEVEGLLAAARPRGVRPKALIAPHAGYVYSGPVAASAYRLLEPLRGCVSRIVLAGPSHRVGFRGIALPAADAFETPLGEVPVDHDACRAIAGLPGVLELPQAHAAEHSLEVHLPFLQIALGGFALVPLVVGEAPASQVGAVLETLWGGPETLIVISSDLSHYLDYHAARQLDHETSAAIERLDFAELTPEHACGCHPVAGLLWLARARGLHCTVLDQRNSGDTAGPRDRVVGYGAYAFTESR